MLQLLNETKIDLKYEILEYTDFIFNKNNNDFNLSITQNTETNYVVVCFLNSENGAEEEYKNITNKKFKDIHYILTIIGLTFSLSGLTFLVCIYIIYPSLRNLHGKDLMCLSLTYIFVYLIMIASMILSKCIELSSPISEPFQVVNENESAEFSQRILFDGYVQAISYGLAVLLHYSFLCTFSWITIISFDICNKIKNISHFITTRVRDRANENYIFKVHLSFGFLILPFLPVCVGVILDIFNRDSKYAPEYGGNAHHFNFWISNRISLFILFTIPVSLLLLLNLTFFVVTLYFIIKTENSTNLRISNNDLMSFRKSRNSRLLLGIKLLIIMGVCWLLGLLAGLLDRDWLFLLYTVCNEFQGFFIFLTFTFNRKVIKLLKKSVSPIS